MKRIVCADDDPGLQEVFPLLCSRAGYEVKMFSNGEQLMEDLDDLPDLYLLDKQLSGIDGMEICRYLKSRDSTRNIPIIIVSASPNLDKLSKAAGADDFLEKPFQAKYLFELLKKYIQ